MDVWTSKTKKWVVSDIWLDSIWYAVDVLTVKTAPRTGSYSGLYVADPE